MSSYDWARLQLKKLLGTTFVDSNGYDALVNMNTLVFGRPTQPTCMLIPYGHGLDGKTVVFGDLLSAVWRDSCGSCSWTMPENEREFQQQGRNFIVRRSLASVFLRNLLLPLKNHEAEISYCSFEVAGKAWCMNMKDIPFIPFAQETSHSRRYRGKFHWAELRNDDARVHEEKRTYKVARPSSEHSQGVVSGSLVLFWMHWFPPRKNLRKRNCEIVSTFLTTIQLWWKTVAGSGHEWPVTRSLNLQTRVRRRQLAIEWASVCASRALPSEVPLALRDALVAMTSQDIRDRRIWPISEIAKESCRYWPVLRSTTIGQCGYFICLMTGSRLCRGKAVEALERKQFDIQRLERSRHVPGGYSRVRWLQGVVQCSRCMQLDRVRPGRWVWGNRRRMRAGWCSTDLEHSAGDFSFLCGANRANTTRIIFYSGDGPSTRSAQTIRGPISRMWRGRRDRQVSHSGWQEDRLLGRCCRPRDSSLVEYAFSCQKVPVARQLFRAQSSQTYPTLRSKVQLSWRMFMESHTCDPIEIIKINVFHDP